MLFAYDFCVKKGSFIQGTEEPTVLMHQADGGILFLDEICTDCPPAGQECVLRLSTKAFTDFRGEQ